jgi:hypothetical protein
MFFLTEDSVIVCKHERGIVQNVPSQDWVTIAQRRILVETDPEGRAIKGCPSYGIGIRPCVTTLKVKVGYSDFISIDGKHVTLDSLSGLTDGTPPGVVKYKVNDPAQQLVEEVQ